MLEVLQLEVVWDWELLNDISCYGRSYAKRVFFRCGGHQQLSTLADNRACYESIGKLESYDLRIWR
jgi:hypothetical protein